MRDAYGIKRTWRVWWKVQGRSGKSSKDQRINCRVVEVVKQTLRLFGHMERTGENEMMMKLSVSKADVLSMRRRLPFFLQHRRTVLEYLRERKGGRETERIGVCMKEMYEYEQEQVEPSAMAIALKFQGASMKIVYKILNGHIT